MKTVNKTILPTLFTIILALLLIAAAISLPYWSSFPDWTGLKDKKAWDLFELLIVPIVLAVGATIFSQSQRNTEIQIETERQRESALQSYIDRIKDLITELHNTLDKTDENIEDPPEMFGTLGNIGAAYTRATLQQLDPKRKGLLLEFLYDIHLLGWAEPGTENEYFQVIFLGENADLSGLIVNTHDMCGINLAFTNLSNSQWTGLNLLKAKFSGCNMSNSNFVGVSLWGADLGGANLRNVKMRGSVLDKADLRMANLHNADLRDASLFEANLEFAKYDRKTRFPMSFDPLKAKMVFEK